MDDNPYAKYVSQPSAGVFTLPPSPQQQRNNDRQDANDRRVAELEAERIRLLQQNADFEREKFNRTHNPDGTPKKAPDVVEQPLTPQQLAAVRAEAETKIGLLDSLGRGTSGPSVAKIPAQTHTARTRMLPRFQRRAR